MSNNKSFSNGTPVNTKSKSQQALNSKTQSGKKNASK